MAKQGVFSMSIAIAVLEEIGKSVLKYSPAVATALGSNAGAFIATLLANKFNVPIYDLKSTIEADTASSQKIKEFEIEHEDELAKISAENFQTEIADKDDARKYDESKPNTDWVLHILTLIFTLGFFTYVIVFHFYPTVTDKEILHDLFGCELLILTFYFGSSFKRNQ
jgi:hypothetical protein